MLQVASSSTHHAHFRYQYKVMNPGIDHRTKTIIKAGLLKILRDEVLPVGRTQKHCKHT